MTGDCPSNLTAFLPKDVSTAGAIPNAEAESGVPALARKISSAATSFSV